MNKTRLVLKLRNGKLEKKIKHDDEIGKGNGCSVCSISISDPYDLVTHMGFDDDTNEPVLFIDSSIVDLEKLSNVEIKEIWSVAITTLLYWYAKDIPHKEYPFIIKEQIFIMYQLMGGYSHIKNIHKLYTKIVKAKTRPSYGKIKDRYVRKCCQMYVSSHRSLFTILTFM